ncbi:hypothetical protein G5C51_00780, partial [Streptomyces sp. A7024]
LLDPDTRIGLAPLSQVAGDRFEAMALTAQDAQRGIVLSPVRVRLTPIVEQIRTALRDGALPLRALEQAVLPSTADQRQQAALRQFLAHLDAIGILQVTTRPEASTRAWHPAAAAPTAAPDTTGGGYLDVYRQVLGAPPTADLRLLGAALTQSMRLQAMIRADAQPTPRAGAGLSAQDRPLLDIVREHLASRTPASGAATPSTHPEPVGWPRATTPGSGYARLLDHLAERTDAGRTIDLTPELLDRFAAPPAHLPWPLDCTVRPLPDGSGALDIVAPAAVLDARFGSALRRLHGGALPSADAYRSWLRRLDADSGIRSVELLFPALSRYAANAVRRPLYPSAWTGDPDLGAYCDDGPATGGFLPLGELTARAGEDGRTVISHRGEPIRPLYHSARTAPPPWDVVAGLLLSASPQNHGWVRRLRHPLCALPEHDYVPRITVAGVLVLSAAQWRVPVHRLPSPDAGGLDQARQLLRLRDELGLPRFVFVSAAPGARAPLPCDLESLQALGVLRRMAGGAAKDHAVVIEEMVPAPGELGVRDRADPAGSPVAAELMLRIPPGG